MVPPTETRLQGKAEAGFIWEEDRRLLDTQSLQFLWAQWIGHLAKSLKPREEESVAKKVMELVSKQVVGKVTCLD